jgi:hypothetical protein
MGRAARQIAEAKFSMQSMVAAYRSLYDQQLGARRAVQHRTG